MSMKKIRQSVDSQVRMKKVRKRRTQRVVQRVRTHLMVSFYWPHFNPNMVNLTRIPKIVKERIAGTFVTKEGRGRILLAGDAAHVHSVNGGQGLNTGISDAFAVAWRFALAVKQQDLSPAQVSTLLQSYDAERRSTAAGVIDVAAALVRDTNHTAKQYVSTIERAAAYITGK